jgi:putative ABC transport system permease protein
MTMRRIAIRALLYEPWKLTGAVLGVAVVGTLVLSQRGLYAGFLESSSSFIARTGGDVWVMARDTRVLDDGEALAPGVRARALRHPCVRRARAVVVDYALLRRPGGGYLTVQVLGYEAPAGSPMPWSLARGLPGDLHGPRRVAVDALDLEKLEIGGDPLGARLRVGRDQVVVAALTQGIRSFTLAPYVFAEAQVARGLLGMSDGAATYWALDLADPRCAGDVVRALAREPDLHAEPTATFVARTQGYWVRGSGVGAVLGAGQALALLVGVVVIAQTLASTTRDRLRELATLKAIGATRSELAGFVGWQTAVLAGVGCALGGVGALGARRVLGEQGLAVVLGVAEVLSALGAVTLMCGVASLAALRMALRVEAGEVLR